MLDVDLIASSDVDRAVTTFHREGFVAVSGALSKEQLTLAQAGARRVIEEQTAAIPLVEANRGFARYSFGQQIHHPEWQQLIDLPAVLPILERIWGSADFNCTGAGGDYSLPGAKIQHLHADIGDFFNDPLGQVTSFDVPAPHIVINYLMVDFHEKNGAIRFIPCTQRNRQAPPALDEEPDWMKKSFVCAPAGTALIRDVRCWHGGTANRSDEVRPMTSAGYFAPWYYRRIQEPRMSRSVYENLSKNAKDLCRLMVDPQLG
ncbi:MAG: hypothetical protein HOH43_20675 [Candidatus Latescibacteria bacterium]|jgi:ectoine hydroxylase-related dioxygenase (phytanoyl-CoA dioxygenase family)|nr:hypothetical protein [Candidatus Latescibacterota bacterium]